MERGLCKCVSSTGVRVGVVDVVILFPFPVSSLSLSLSLIDSLVDKLVRNSNEMDDISSSWLLASNWRNVWNVSRMKGS